MVRPTSIRRVYFLGTLVIIVVLTGSLGGFWISGVRHNFEARVAELEKELLKARKDALHYEVEEVVEDIRFRRERAQKEIRRTLRHRVLDAYALATNLHGEYQGKLAEQEIRQIIIHRLSQVRFDSGRGYYFATRGDEAGEIVADHPELTARKLTRLPAISEVTPAKSTIGFVTGDEEAFYRYDAPKPGQPDKLVPKLSFVQYFQPFGWYVGTGVYLDDVERENQSEILERVYEKHSASDRDVYIFRYDGTILYHRRAPLVGRNILTMTDADGREIYRAVLAAVSGQGEGFFEFRWTDSETERTQPKICYARACGDWQWIIAMDRHIDDIQALLEKKKGELATRINQDLSWILLLCVGAIGVALLLSHFFSKRLADEFKIFLAFFRDAANSHIIIDKSNLRFHEFRHVAESANQMIEDRRIAEQTLFNEKERLAVTLLSIGDGVISTDTKGNILLMNRVAEILTGWTQDEAMGRPLGETFRIVNETTREPCVNPVDRVIATGTTVALANNTLLIAKDGTERMIADSGAPIRDWDGNVVGVVLVFRDVTAPRRAREERSRLVTAIEQAAEGVIVMDKNWLIRYVNPAFERLSGYGKTEILGRHSRILRTEKHDRAFYRNIKDTLDRGDVWSGRLTSERKDGTFYEAEVTTSPVRDQAGATINYVSIHRDITNEVRLERELRQAQKMETIGTLAGGIAHDFNNILTAIIGYTQIALARVPEGSPARPNLEQVLESSSRATDLVKQILTFSRHTEPELRPMQLAPIVEEVLKLLRSSLPTTIDLLRDIAVSPEGGIVLADPTQIHQVLMNLCTNAAHAMRTQGRGMLTVRLAETEVDAFEAARHHELRSGPYVWLTVSDTGHGMEAATIERIFDPYFTTKGLGEGTGLGLAVVKGIVESCKGAITVYSEPGKGTTFNVYLPRIEHDPRPQAKPVEADPTGAERILFVDDERALAELSKEMLEPLGYELVVRTNSREALETFRADPYGIDLVITDMTMPGLTGAELAKEILAIRPSIPIILCTGFSELINDRQAKEAGICELVMKPYAVKNLSRTIRKVLGQR